MARNSHYTFLLLILMKVLSYAFNDDIQEIDDEVFVSVTEEDYVSEPPSESTPFSVQQVVSSRNLIIVSTIDGQVSGIDPETGRTVWNLATDGNLLVSSLSKLKVRSEGNDIRVVPSLDGRLFKFDGQKLELLPMSIEKLLSNSQKLGENLFVVGKKEMINYGVNSLTGELKYICNVEGCNIFSNVTEEEDILVIERMTQSMRAINARNGREEWYFSVGDLSLSLQKGSDKSDYTKANGSALIPKDKLILPVGAKITVAMADGSFGVMDSSTNNLLWSQTLPSPITNIWQLKENDVVRFDLFDEDLESESETTTSKSQLYVGRYDKNLYIKMSDKNYSSGYLKQNTLRPSYLPAHGENHGTELSVVNIDSIYDKGVIFYESDSSVIENNSQCSANQSHEFLSSRESSNVHVACIYVALIIVILITAVYTVYWAKMKWKKVQMGIDKMTDLQLSLEKYGQSTESQNSYIDEEDEQNDGKHDSSTLVDFSSRFLNDFEPTKCLGKGAFGIVFETWNKIDDCSYAVKRISLIKTAKVYTKVLREVKALATLDHPGIVRYFNAWIEEPPLNWQEHKDKKWLTTLKGFKDFYSVGDPGELSFKLQKEKKIGAVQLKKKQKNLSVNPWRPFDDILDISSSSESESLDSPTDKPKMYLYIQMQLCKKESLKEWLWANNDHRDHKQILFYFYQLISAVEYIHSRGMIHRDLKPSNVFFAMDGSIKVGDFGLVRTVDKKIASYDRLVKHSTDVGTKLYMSPEQVQHRPYNYKVDIYSLGIIFVELLCPFSTNAERCKVLKNARKLKFSKDFEQQYPMECSFVSRLLSPTSFERPSANAVIKDSLFDPFRS